MEVSIVAQPNCREGSVTANVSLMKIGDSAAQNWIFSHLMPRVLSEARCRIGSQNTRYFDAEEIAADVLEALLLGACRFQHLKTRTDLYKLTSVLLRNKCIDAYRRMLRKRRLEVGESGYSFRFDYDNVPNRFHEALAAPEDTDALAKELLDLICESIHSLKDNPSDCRLILQKIMEGYSIPEIAQVMMRGERYVRRVLERIERHFLNSPQNLPW